MKKNTEKRVVRKSRVVANTTIEQRDSSRLQANRRQIQCSGDTEIHDRGRVGRGSVRHGPYSAA